MTGVWGPQKNESRSMSMSREGGKDKGGDLSPPDLNVVFDVVSLVGKALATEEFTGRLASAGGEPDVSLLERWAGVQAIYSMVEGLVLEGVGLGTPEGRAGYVSMISLYTSGDAEASVEGESEEVKAAVAQVAQELCKAIDGNIHVLLDAVGMDTSALPQESLTVQQTKEIEEVCIERVKDSVYVERIKKLGREADLSSGELEKDLTLDVLIPLRLEAVAQHGLKGEEGFVLFQYMTRHAGHHPQILTLNAELQETVGRTVQLGIQQRSETTTI